MYFSCLSESAEGWLFQAGLSLVAVLHKVGPTQPGSSLLGGVVREGGTGVCSVCARSGTQTWGSSLLEGLLHVPLSSC